MHEKFHPYLTQRMQSQGVKCKKSLKNSFAHWSYGEDNLNFTSMRVLLSLKNVVLCTRNITYQDSKEKCDCRQCFKMNGNIKHFNTDEPYDESRFMRMLTCWKSVPKIQADYVCLVCIVFIDVVLLMENTFISVIYFCGCIGSISLLPKTAVNI